MVVDDRRFSGPAPVILDRVARGCVFEQIRDSGQVYMLIGRHGGRKTAELLCLNDGQASRESTSLHVYPVPARLVLGDEGS